MEVMTTTATRKDLQRLFESFTETAAQYLGPDERYVLETGSSTYGRAYRLHIHRGESRALYSSIFDDYLGMTASEAHHTLSTILRTLHGIDYWADRQARANA